MVPGRPFCCGLWAVGRGVRETLGANRGIPLAKLLRGWPCACRCAPAPASPPQRFAAGTHGPRRAAWYAYHGPAACTEARRGGQVRELPFMGASDCHWRAADSLRRRSRASTSAMRVPRALTAAASRARAPRSPCSSFGTGTPRRRLCVGAAIHQLRPMPDRTRSKRRRGAPRCRPSVYADPARERTTNQRKVRAVRLHAWHPTKCR